MFDIARSMVKEYGMSDKVGQVYFAREKQSRFLDVSGMQGAVEYSQAKETLEGAELEDLKSK